MNKVRGLLKDDADVSKLETQVECLTSLFQRMIQAGLQFEFHEYLRTACIASIFASSVILAQVRHQTHQTRPSNL